MAEGSGLKLVLITRNGSKEAARSLELHVSMAANGDAGMVGLCRHQQFYEIQLGICIHHGQRLSWQWTTDMNTEAAGQSTWSTG